VNDVSRFLLAAKADQEKRRHVDSTGIALTLTGAALVFASLCMFGWAGLVVLLLAPLFL
jgi:hypothetical protein